MVLNSRHRIAVVALLAGLSAAFISACGPVHADPKWAAVSTVEDGTKIMLAFGDHLSLINVTDGKPVELVDSDGKVRLDDKGNPRLWEVRSSDNTQTRFYTNPVVVNADTILAGSYDDKVVEIDYPTARINETAAIANNHIVASPLLDGDFLYVGLSESDLVALKVSDLTEVWRLKTAYGVWAKPLLVGDVLYVSSLDHFLYAVDKATGKLLWKSDMQGAITGTAAYNNGHLYVGSFARKIFDVSAEDGKILGEMATNDWVWSGPIISDGDLYATDQSGMVYAVDIASGLKQIWGTQAATKAIPPSPLVTDQYVIVGSRDHNVYWLNRSTGAVTDTKAVAGEILSELVLVNPSDTVKVPEPLVIVSSSANQELLVAFTLERGQRLWAYGR